MAVSNTPPQNGTLIVKLTVQEFADVRTRNTKLGNRLVNNSEPYTEISLVDPPANEDYNRGWWGVK